MVTRAAVQERAASEDAGRGASGSAIQEPPSAAGAPSAGGGAAVSLDKDVFWFAATGKDRFRWSMLSSLPLLRQVRASSCGSTHVAGTSLAPACPSSSPSLPLSLCLPEPALLSPPPPGAAQ